MTKKLIFRIALLVGTIVSMFFIPWIFIKIWLTPLPETIPEQAAQALEYGFDGVIVYVDQGGKEAEVFAAGWKNREKKYPLTPGHFSK